LQLTLLAPHRAVPAGRQSRRFRAAARSAARKFRRGRRLSCAGRALADQRNRRQAGQLRRPLRVRQRFGTAWPVRWAARVRRRFGPVWPAGWSAGGADAGSSVDAVPAAVRRGSAGWFVGRRRRGAGSSAGAG